MTAEEASPEEAEPVSSSSWTAVAMIGTLGQKRIKAHIIILSPNAAVKPSYKNTFTWSEQNKKQILCQMWGKTSDTNNKEKTYSRFFLLSAHLKLNILILIARLFVMFLFLSSPSCIWIHQMEYSLIKPQVLCVATNRWFSLLGPKESFISRCRWMARWGILSRGLETWTSRLTSLSPLCKRRSPSALIAK